jgi:hypothetical protein
MRRSLLRPFTALFVGIALLLPARPAKALSIGGAVAIGVVVVGVVVIAVVATSYHFLHHPTIKGCVSSGPDGLQLTDEYAQQVFQLGGNSAGIKSGDLVKLKGHKQKHSVFLVDEVTKDYGVCNVTPSKP